MKRKILIITTLFCLSTILFTRNSTAEDSRELVKLPAMMQSHMLQNMRDHLLALSEIMAALEEGNKVEAVKIAESRLGMSSMDSHGASHMAPFMPTGMRQVGTAMHKAASHFGVVVQDASLEEADKEAGMIFGALREITDACNACHAGYRIR